MRYLAVLTVAMAALVVMMPKPRGKVGKQCANDLATLTYPAVERPAGVLDPASKPFDVVVWGATGFTGQLVARYLDEQYPAGTGGGFAWALAGRSQQKLDKLLAELTSSPPVIVADSTDAASLQRMCDQTRVVLTTVGPYTLYGSLLVETAAKSGVNYVDLSGETNWQVEMLERFHADAVRTGAKVVVAGGYDSVPFDLGALAARQALKRTHGVAATEIVALVEQMRGYASGGTVASAWQGIKDVIDGRVTLKQANDPYALSPNEECRADTDMSGWGMFPRFDRDVGALGVMHLMAPVNSRVVRRSLALAGQRNCSYGEGMSAWALLDGLVFIVTKVLTGQFPLADLAPSPGQGPPQAVLEEGLVRIKVVAKGEDGQGQSQASAVRVSFQGDPGYNATSKMLAETALCLSSEQCHGQGIGPGGGVLTSASACGQGLVDRLQQAEGGAFMAFEVL